MPAVRFDPEQGKHVKSIQMSGLCEHVSGSEKVRVYVSDSQENSSSERIPQVQRKGMTVHNNINTRVSVVNTLAFGFRTENYTTYSIHYIYIWINYMNVSFVLTYIRGRFRA